MTLRVEIEAIWRFRNGTTAEPMVVMLDFLNEIRATGKITHAARSAGISYRHAWNLIEKWSDFFGAPLVERQRGRGTTLTTFGEKLVWAGQRLRARLKPQLENLSQELETELNQLLPSGPATIRAHASHGFAVAKLRELLSRDTDVAFDVRYVNAQTALASLARGDCDLAGMHLPTGPLRQRSIRMYRPYLTASVHRVISFVTREMGLMVKRGNPLSIRSLDRLRDREIRFVNRDTISGTRMLFDQLLALHDIDGTAINGYEQVEFTHAAVAAYVASGMADAGFGVEAAAKQFDLDFIPLLTEDYFFVCHKELLNADSIRHVLGIMQSREFLDAVRKLPGYAPKDCGSIKTISEVFREPLGDDRHRGKNAVKDGKFSRRRP